ncbi:MAG: hypothetical protein HN459_05580 [Candidatus Marinimicrobia bacterium]|jgi:hypothetical protein|nr:hypothetical protein [Candidatus Neomarinimicrobiota bacterium]
MQYFKPFSIILFVSIQMSLCLAQDPPGIEWKQIQTDHYQIIFPNELATEGNRVANTLEHVHQQINKSLPGRHLKIPVLLNNRSAIPNGFVGQAPWVSEWNHVPLMLREMGSTEWYRDLAIHEGRHIIQINYMNIGMSRLVGGVFGEATQSLYTGLLIPSWYWEGDAVGIETALTHSGRGRSAYFSRIARGHILSGNQISYRKTLYGSLKNEYPNQYELGYYLTTHVKKEYGAEAWPTILKKSLMWPFTLNPFFPLSRAMKTSTGSTLPQIYHDTFYDLEMAWKMQWMGLKKEESNDLTPDRKIVTHYRYPAAGKEGKIISLKSSLGDVNTIVQIIAGEEVALKKIQGSSELFGFHSNGNQMVWSAYDPDVRWTKRSWANIRVYDIKTDNEKRITHNKRFYQPNISPNGEKIAVVSFSEDRHSLLVILDAKTGSVMDQVEAPNSGLIMTPAWSKDGAKVVFTAQKFEGRALYIYRLKNRQFDLVNSSAWQHLYRPIFYNNYILYESQVNGIDQIVAIDLKTKEEYRITSSKFGAYNPRVTPLGKLLFNEYSIMGDGISTMDLDTVKWDILDSNRNSIRVGHFTEYQSESIFDTSIPSYSYKVSSYNGLQTLFNFHSRYIFDDELNPTLGIQSDNILGTLAIGGEISYNKNENTIQKRIRGIYKGFYPILDFELSIGERNIGYGPFSQKIENRNDTLKFSINEKWDEFVFDFGATLPLKNKKKGIRTHYAYAKIGSRYTSRSNTYFHYNFTHIPPNIRVKNREKRDDRDGGIMPVYFESGYISIDEKSVRDLGNPGWQIYGYYGNTPLGGLWKGNQVSLRFQHGMKGIGKHHFVSSIFQYETNKGVNILPSKVSFPYGYNWQLFESIWRVKVKYKMPLFYPDWVLPFGISYLKRIQVGVFVDKTSGNGQNSMMAVGGGITFESAGFFDIKFPIPFTINYYYQPETGKSGIQLDFE